MIRTLNTQDIIEISLEANENLDVLQSLISGLLEEESDVKFSYILVLMCELVYINGTILHVLRKDFQDIQFKDEKQNEIIVSKVTLETITALLIARWRATSELNSFSYSVSYN